MTYIFGTRHQKSIKLYINIKNKDIIFLIISHSNYLMEFENQCQHKNKDEFLTLKNLKVHHTKFTDVFAQLVTINAKIYVGLQRSSYYEDKNNPRLKSIIPI